MDPQLLLAYYPRFSKYLTDLRSQSTPACDDGSVEQLSFFINFLENDYGTTIRKIDTLKSHNEITFDLLWAILLPQTALVTSCDVTSEPQALRLQSLSLQKGPHHSYWILNCEYIDAMDNPDKLGQRFGLAPKSITINKFDGVMPITGLCVYPIDWHPNVAKLRAKLVERGAKWLHWNGVHHAHYNGFAHRRKGDGYPGHDGGYIDRRYIKVKVGLISVVC